MKIAVIGTGKTGSKVLELLSEERVVGPFNTEHPPTIEKLKTADVAIIFVPGDAVDDILETVLKSGVAAAWASTGYAWPEDLDSRCKERGVTWVRASNFSLGMNIIRRCIDVISEGSVLLNDPSFHIHEVHHTDKKDAPSGTAISWKNWLAREAEITSERKGDIKGIHTLRVSTESESIHLEHEAHKRTVFAEGAIWAAEQLLQSDLEPGFYDFSTIFDKAMKE
ncbi:MAG: dihydrodipicolinate reductase C-terminal domain-containing protein [Balneolaceae bacterium]|nr:dihydrodipicolinate reductase C-terminal domain-containing protein [Balneolaceae bacterium]